MARKSDRQIIEELLEQFEPEIRAAFLAAIEDIVDNIDLSALIAALRKSDINAALRALHIEPAAFRQLERVITAAFEAGGSSMRLTMPVIRDTAGIRIGVRFDPGDPAAADRIRRHGANLVTRIVEDQRTSLRKAISEGLDKGANPRDVAVEIAGPFDARAGRRQGGIIGLTDSQREYVANAQRELLSGNPSEMRKYLNREARLRSFDDDVLAAITSGKPLDPSKVQQIVGRYNDSLLKARADLISRTETMQAVNLGRHESSQQTMREAGITEDQVTRTWRSTKDKRTRDSHRVMDGQQVTGFDQPFRSPSGAGLRYPGDPEAPLSETIQCRCVVTVSIKKPDRQG